MPDYNPFVLRRMLALRQFRIFRDADLGELANIAENVADETFSAGTVIARRGARVPALQLVVDGRIASSGSQADTWGPREVFGALEVLARRELSAPVVAAVDTRTLQLFATDITEVLDENFGVLRAVLRGLAARAVALHRRRSRLATSGTSALGFVERLVIVRQLLPFANAGLDALVELARVAEPVRFDAGTTIARAGEPVTAALVVVSGALAIDGEQHLVAGDAIGAVEMLGELPHARAVETVAPTVALRVPASALFDVLEDHTDLGLATIRSLAAELLDAPREAV